MAPPHTRNARTGTEHGLAAPTAEPHGDAGLQVPWQGLWGAICCSKRRFGHNWSDVSPAQHRWRHLWASHCSHRFQPGFSCILAHSSAGTTPFHCLQEKTTCTEKPSCSLNPPVSKLTFRKAVSGFRRTPRRWHFSPLPLNTTNARGFLSVTVPSRAGSVTGDCRHLSGTRHLTPAGHRSQV